MQIPDIIDLSALVAEQGPRLILGDRPAEVEPLNAYWVAARARSNVWSAELRGHAEPGPVRWTQLRALVEEILAAEVLARVWTAVVSAWDERLGVADAAPVVRNVLHAHLEVRHRALTLVLHGRGIRARDAAELNVLRRRAERWCDLLIGYVAVEHDVLSLAPDPERAAEFASDLNQRGGWRAGGQAWRLLKSSLLHGFGQSLSSRSRHTELNRRVGAAVIACFDGDLLQGHAWRPWLWMSTLEQTVEDTQALLDELRSEAAETPAG